MFPKRDIYIGGRKVPGIQSGAAWRENVTLTNGKVIPTMFAEITTLRETNPDGPNPGQTYLRTTPENLGFTTLRFTNVAGLDYDPETGALLTLEDLEVRRGADIAARQTANLAARATPSVNLDDIDLDAIVGAGGEPA